MYYEINVSLNGQHYFATDKRSITNSQKCIEMVNDFQSRFPSSEGFLISVTFHPETSYTINLKPSDSVHDITTKIQAMSNI